MSPILAFPHEIFLIILEHLHYASDLTSFAQTCRPLYGIISTSSTYHNLAKKVPYITLRHIVQKRNIDALKILLDNDIDWRPIALPHCYGPSCEYHDFVAMVLALRGPSYFRNFPEFEHQPILIALEHGYVDLLRELDRGLFFDPEHAEDVTDVRTPMFWAAESLEFLIEIGADLNLLGYGAYGSTPLIDALKFERLDHVRILLEAGQDPNECSQAEKSHLMPIWAVAHTGDVDLLQLFWERGAQYGHPDKQLWNSEINRLVTKGCTGTMWDQPRPTCRETALMVLKHCGLDLKTEIVRGKVLSRRTIVAVLAATGDENLLQDAFEVWCGDDEASVMDLLSNEEPYFVASYFGHYTVLQFLFDELRKLENSDRDIEEAAYTSVIRGASRGQANNLTSLRAILDTKSHLSTPKEEALRFFLSINDSKGEQELSHLILEASNHSEIFADVNGLERVTKSGDFLLLRKMLDRSCLGPLDQIDARLGLSSILQVATAYTPPESVMHILGWGVKLDPQDPMAVNVLIETARHKKIEIAQVFFDNGFDVNGIYAYTERNHQYKPRSLLSHALSKPFHWGCKGTSHRGCRGVSSISAFAQLLIKNGFEFERLTSFVEIFFFETEHNDIGFSPCEESEVLKIFLDAGIDPLQRKIEPQDEGSSNMTWLEQAILKGHYKYVRQFLRHVKADDQRLKDFLSQASIKLKYWANLGYHGMYEQTKEMWEVLWKTNSKALDEEFKKRGFVDKTSSGHFDSCELGVDEFTKMGLSANGDIEMEKAVYRLLVIKELDICCNRVIYV